MVVSISGAENFEIRGAQRAHELGLVVTYQKRGKGIFTLLSVEVLFEAHLDTSITSVTMEVVWDKMGLCTFIYPAV
jgi:hypothetical protein